MMQHEPMCMCSICESRRGVTRHTSAPPAPEIIHAEQILDNLSGIHTGLLESAPPAAAAQETADQLVVEIARELYDRFVMGGWEPQDAYPQIERWLASRVQGLEDRLAVGQELAQRVASLVEELPIYSTSSSMYQRVEHVKRLLAALTEDSHGPD